MRRRILNTMNRLEIVLERGQIPAVCDLLCEHATGYTVIPEVTGFGHHGKRDGDLAVIVTVLTREHLDPVLDHLLPILNQRSGVALITEVKVLRGEHFVPELKGRVTAGAAR